MPCPSPTLTARVLALFSPLLLLFFVSGGNAQKDLSKSRPLRTLIVSGGPTVTSNEYAIEANARYVEKLTARGKSQRVLFADGKRASRTISALEAVPNEKEATVLAWILDEGWPDRKPVFRASALKRLDGASNNTNILRETRSLAASAQPGERGLVYFAGHGSTGTKMLFIDDAQNTHYSTWGNGNLSMRTLAPALQSWPQNVPLTLVMVQCHSGGFGNLIFQDGDPDKGIWQRDFCGFFASLGELMSAGCTDEMDEENYHDFTTHFFAALSGVSRDGRLVTGADYDKNGVVSGLEALAFAHLRDDSIDVPVCTSDIYLRSLWKDEGQDWMKTPYSAILKNATKWQEAVLVGLSRELRLSGETRVQAAFNAYQQRCARMGRTASSGYGSSNELKMNQPEFSKLFYALEADLQRRFPQLKSRQSRGYAAAKQRAIAYLKTRPAQVAKIYEAEKEYERSGAIPENRKAKLMRFVRMARTVVLQERVKTLGTAEQKAIFARLRTSESRNFLK